MLKHLKNLRLLYFFTAIVDQACRLATFAALRLCQELPRHARFMHNHSSIDAQVPVPITLKPQVPVSQSFNPRVSARTPPSPPPLLHFPPRLLPGPQH